jgi:hypothetical protein
VPSIGSLDCPSSLCFALQVQEDIYLNFYRVLHTAAFGHNVEVLVGFTASLLVEPTAPVTDAKDISILRTRVPGRALVNGAEQ